MNSSEEVVHSILFLNLIMIQECCTKIQLKSHFLLLFACEKSISLWLEQLVENDSIVPHFVCRKKSQLFARRPWWAESVRISLPNVTRDTVTILGMQKPCVETW